MKRPVVLAILDGFGETKKEEGNAVKAAKTPTLDAIVKKYPTAMLQASGAFVGLPEGQIGNSEVGHTNIGAGRIVYQSLARINNAIEDKTFFSNEAFLSVINNCKKNSSALHLLGLLSDGGVHSHINHIYALLELAKKEGLTEVYIDVFTDGRDVSPNSAVSFIKELTKKIKEIGVGKIATISGRYYAMDRDNRWDRVKKAYDAIVNGIGKFEEDPLKVVEDSYKEGITDEFIVPCVCLKGVSLKENDGVIFFNFRPDRARQITKALTFKDFDGFEREKGYFKVFFVCMTRYDETFKDVLVAYDAVELKNTFGEYISKKGLKQLRIAETEKYAHVTFFFNGGKEEKFLNEDRILIKSPAVATYDLKPQMSAFEVCSEVVSKIESLEYDVIILNFANCDMVGHTGVFDACVKAVETVDSCVLDILKAVEKVGGVLIITADHGNAEEMIDSKGGVLTSHTTNPVIFSVLFHDCKLKEKGRLCDIAPTMLNILGLEKPQEMTGESLICD